MKKTECGHEVRKVSKWSLFLCLIGRHDYKNVFIHEHSGTNSYPTTGMDEYPDFETGLERCSRCGHEDYWNNLEM